MHHKHLKTLWPSALGLFLVALFVALCLGSAQADGGLNSPFGITSHYPAANAVGVPLSANVQATFDDDVLPSSVTSDTFVVHGHLGGLASGSLSYDGGTRTVTLDPDRAFHAGEVLRLSATSAISSTGAAALTPHGWQFIAGPVRSRSVAGFTDTGAGLTGVAFSSAAWGDYDNDGDLDILLTGADDSYVPVSKVYRNDGASGFTDIGAGLTGVQNSSAAWGDYDRDGNLDILLTGDVSYINRVSTVYRNDGDASGFTDIGAGLTGVSEGSVAWGDYDNDGDLDILLTGRAGSTDVSKVYRNDGGGAFTDIAAGLTGGYHSSVAWGDYDNDGDLDILLTGAHSGWNAVCEVYRNDGVSGFADIGAGLAGVYDGSVAWGDYDNDGDLDILLAGSTAAFPDTNPVSKIYRNDTPSGFTDIGAGLIGVEYGSVAWGDVDNDGDLDILLTGEDSSWNPVSKVYRNDGVSGFTDIGAGLMPVLESSVAWGDYDNDGDLDVLLTGYLDPNFVSKVYRNNSRPELGAVAPSSGSGPVGVTTYFTTTWSDPDGWENLKQCYFHIGASPSLAGNVTLLYNAVKDKLWLLDDSGTIWLGGCYPGQATGFWNSQAVLDCGQTAVQGAGDTLGVRWAIVFKPGFEGTEKLGLKCKDLDKARARAAWEGTWTITGP